MELKPTLDVLATCIGYRTQIWDWDEMGLRLVNGWHFPLFLERRSMTGHS